MGYKVKWIEDNLGVSRKALRVFERVGLLPPNPHNQHRDYTDKDLDRIWTIRVLQGMGYKLKEIVDMQNDNDFDFEQSLANKIKKLEEEKNKIERHLGYAKTIKLTGRFPMRPNQIGTVRFDEFMERSLSEWNITQDPQAEKYLEITEMLLSKDIDEWSNNEIGAMISSLNDTYIAMLNPNCILNDSIIPKEIIKRMPQGASNPEIQLLVKMLYDNHNDMLGDDNRLTECEFARFYSSSFIVGDIARIKEKTYGKEGCSFIADAIAYFGGYSSYDEMQKQL